MNRRADVNYFETRLSRSVGKKHSALAEARALPREGRFATALVGQQGRACVGGPWFDALLQDLAAEPARRLGVAFGPRHGSDARRGKPCSRVWDNPPPWGSGRGRAHCGRLVRPRPRAEVNRLRKLGFPLVSLGAWRAIPPLKWPAVRVQRSSSPIRPRGASGAQSVRQCVRRPCGPHGVGPGRPCSHL